MRFTEEVVLFDFAGIPMVGCLDTGYAIGLTEQGAAVCARMLEEDVPEDDVTAVDPALLEHLARGGFFQRVVAEPRVLSAYLHVTQRCNLACAGCYSLHHAHGFDELVEAVRMVQRAGISAHIIPTVHAKNVGDLASYVQLSRDLGASLNFSLLTCEPDDEVLGGLLPGADELRMLGRALLTLDNGKPLPAMDAPVGVNLTVKRNCGAGCKSLSVDADGTIYPCHMLHRPELAMGNAFTDAVLDALQTDVSRTFQTLDAEKFEDCGTCRYLRICGGGCRARSLFESGNLESKDSYCLMTQEFYDVLGKAMSESLQQRR